MEFYIQKIHNRVTKVEINLNPYQGLKPMNGKRLYIQNFGVEINLNPYQGLKHGKD